MSKPKVIFFGNGPLADAVLEVIKPHYKIIFHAHDKADLDTVRELKKSPDTKIFGILASFGVIIPEDILKLFEPYGIFNVHPSCLPKYRGPSPIESAILAGDTKFGVSIMKLVKEMDAGPIYFQCVAQFELDPSKAEIYQRLGELGATWLSGDLTQKSDPTPQDDSEATYTQKLDKSMSPLRPDQKTALELHNEVRAFLGFPRSRYTFFDIDCIILKTHLSNSAENSLSLKCKDGQYLCIDQLQPAGKKPMDAKSFLNGYGKKAQK